MKTKRIFDPIINKWRRIRRVPVRGFPNYLVCEDGRIWSKVVKRYIAFEATNRKGYLRVNLWRGNKMHRFFIHRLVAKAFIPNPSRKAEVNHLDRDKKNNHVSNLAWCTHTENMKHYRESSKKEGLPKSVREHNDKYFVPVHRHCPF